MAVRISRRKWALAAGLGLIGWLVLVASCGSEEMTATPVATVSPTSTLTAAGGPVFAAGPSPASTATFTPTPEPTAAPPATATTATAPAPTATLAPGPSPVPQTVELKLELSSPPGDQVVASETVTVAGMTSPDATVSVNGILVTPDADGRFSIELTADPEDNPLPIEVIATSVAGEQLSLVRTVIFIP